MSKRRERKKKKRPQRSPSARQHFTLGHPRSSFRKHFKTHRHHQRHLQTFMSDVADNPYYCAADPDRIARLTWSNKIASAGYPKGSYRWKQKDLRIVYKIDETMYVVTPLDAADAGDIPYR